jgi:ribonuclease HI
METELKIFTDGGCSGNPGPGGWAYVISAGGEDGTPAEILAEKWGAEGNTTNNRMELKAVIAALEAVSAPEGGSAAATAVSVPAAGRITVFTDSQYVQRGITQWIQGWKKNNWRTFDKKPVKNQDLWERLDRLASDLAPRWVWVRGHAGNEMNERCDRMTRKAIASIK